MQPIDLAEISTQITEITKIWGLRRSSRELKISRGKLSQFLGVNFRKCEPAFLRSLNRRISEINVARKDDAARLSDLFKLAKSEADHIG